MSHLGPGSPVVGTPAAETTPEKVEGAITPHPVPHKAARPLIFQAHISEYDAVRGGADVCCGDVNMAVGAPGYVSGSQSQRPCQMDEGSCAASVDVVCNDLNMEVMVPACEDQGSAIACYGDASAKAGFDYSSQMVQVQGGVMPSFQEHSPRSVMPYQMGLWIHNSLLLSHGNGKLEQPISPVDFLDVCFLCKRRLRHERDIFIYRGDTAFCSEECRHRQIVNDERRSSRAKNKRGGARASSSSETAVAA